jgi:saccharopine dehydrogenase-like NADP-dependent oxidoreductase
MGVKMKILLLGVGMQGRAAMYDLAQRDEVTEIIAGDWDIKALREHVAERGYGRIVRCEQLNAAVPENLDWLIGQGADVIINLLPTQFVNSVATAAIQHRIHLAFTSYITPELIAMAGEAKTKGITILPEFGLDPGIDLVMLGHAVRSLDRVEDILCYGAGFPDEDAANNPIKYKISWTFDGVLKSYRRAGRIIQEGKVVDIGDTEMFSPKNMHLVNIPGIGSLEAYPNGDVLPYADLLGIEHASLRNLGRYAARWPGHCAFWNTIVDLHLLDGDPVMVDGQPVNPQHFMAAALAPHLQYADDERDVTLVRVEVRGQKNGEKKHLVYQMVDKRDLETGFMSMNRTVGFTVSIGALMIGSGQISKRGLLSPVNDIPFDRFVQELAARNIKITKETTRSAPP